MNPDNPLVLAWEIEEKAAELYRLGCKSSFMPLAWLNTLHTIATTTVKRHEARQQIDPFGCGGAYYNGDKESAMKGEQHE